MSFWLKIAIDFVLDDTNGLCYKVMESLNHFEASEDACQAMDAEMVQFENDNQVEAFIQLLKTGCSSNWFLEFLKYYNSIKIH
jgi:hypothetical protein